MISASVTIAMPLCVKPAKDSLRDSLYPNATTGPDQDPPKVHIPLVLCKFFKKMHNNTLLYNNL